MYVRSRMIKTAISNIKLTFAVVCGDGDNYKPAYVEVVCIYSTRLETESQSGACRITEF
jgi:hypothetical protein